MITIKKLLILIAILAFQCDVAKAKTPFNDNK